MESTAFAAGGADNRQKVKEKRGYSREQRFIFILILLATFVSWIYTIINSGDGGMMGMSMDLTGAADPSMENEMAERLLASAIGLNVPDFIMFVPMWVVMCIGMMLPTALPMVFTYNIVSKRRRMQKTAITQTSLFMLGYVILWSAFGVICWLAGKGIELWIGGWLSEWRNLMLAVGIMFLAAGIYQISSLKDACLNGCRHPISFIMHNWREGYAGATIMGMQHGAECIGCCWALMVILFPLGMMNLVWMGLFTIIMFVEKNVKYGVLISKITGWLLIAAGIIQSAVSIIIKI